ncbi:MAG: sigma-54 dependent transcriptional regulator, partial [Bdellovibrionaceae bacterium]|nr:sigma-54 dependent transcriptional regulator [Pseudobdellovibrionaceae bacterium]
MARILIVDDDPQMLSFLKDAVISDGHEAVAFSHPLRALEEILKWEEAPDLAILDQQMPDLDGIELLRRLKLKWEHLPAIMVTAYGSISSAVEAMKKGAFDYLTKPFKLGDLKVSLTRALELSRLARENMILRQELKKNYAQGGLIGKSKAMRELMELVARVAPAQSNVLITGESGTGKEVVAKTIHQLSSRRDKPFVAINCSAIPENLLESELFGHAKGSFTGADRKKAGLFEEAQGGTLFLDEIGDMDLLLQAKLLRVLQERKIRPVGETKDIDIDVRVIAATQKDLKKAIKEGLFREDLYYRLNVIPVHVPPLRFRKEDIPLLAQHFLNKYATIN